MTVTGAGGGGKIEELLKWLEVDRSVIYVVMRYSWRLLTGIVTLLLIARYFSPEVQGYYYTFSGVLALQSFVELGFYLVVINVSSHEWSRLELGIDGGIAGDQGSISRLASLGRIILKWYAVASLIFVAGVGAGGLYFFSRSHDPGVSWTAPWLAVVFLTGLMLWALPLVSMLEGCNQVEAVNRTRLVEAVLASIVLWLALWSGMGLWATVMTSGTSLLVTLYLLFGPYRRFFATLFRAEITAAVTWRTEIWPMQWRLAIQGMVGYFLYSLFTPVLFHFHGAAVAGQMGMTWQAITTIQAVALAWVYTKAPRFGMFVARREYASLDRLWFRSTAISLGVISSGGCALWILVLALQGMQVSLGERLLPLYPTAVFILATILHHIVQCIAVYLRAHKREALTPVAVLSSLTCGGLVLWLGSRSGAVGAAWAYLFANLAIAVPGAVLIWFRSRKAWQVP